MRFVVKIQFNYFGHFFFKKIGFQRTTIQKIVRTSPKKLFTLILKHFK